MKTRSLLLPCLLVAPLLACGGSSPTGQQPPTPPPGSPVSGFVFYDEDGDSALDPAEAVRLPGVTVSIGGRTAQTGPGGRFTVENVPQGAQSAAATTLPAYFAPGAAISVSVPQGGELAVPATLAIGAHAQPNVFMAFGDSITWGEGSSNAGGYRDFLYADLRSHWGGSIEVQNEGLSGTKSRGGLRSGEARIETSLSRRRPSWVLILYGTNDWNDAECRNDFPCYTIDALRYMVGQTRDAGAHPVLGTIPPVNPAFLDRSPEERNAWVTRMNERVRALASEQRVALADVHRDFLAQPSLKDLFNDFLHPNDEGYRVMSRSFFNAITRPLGATGSSGRGGFSFGFTRF